jgi:hypothetical protein
VIDLDERITTKELEFSQSSKLPILLEIEKDLLRRFIYSGFRLFIFCRRIKGKSPGLSVIIF